MELLAERSVRELTMEAVAKRAGVGKPMLYKWWPTKGALILAAFEERMAGRRETQKPASTEGAIRARVHRLIEEFNGPFGKIMAELIGEGQSERAVLRELYERHISVRRAPTVADIEWGKTTGEFSPNADSQLIVDGLFGPLYYRLLLGLMPLKSTCKDELVDQLLSGVR